MEILGFYPWNVTDDSMCLQCQEFKMNYLFSLLDDCSHMLGILHSSLMDSDHICSIIVRDEFYEG